MLREARSLEWPLDSLPVIGIHKGLFAYTIGQRRGLHIPWKEPLFVRECHDSQNCLVVSPKSLLAISACSLKNINIFLPLQKWPPELFIRLRYNQAPVPCRAVLQKNKLLIRLSKPVSATARGQLGAIFTGRGELLAGGLADELFFMLSRPLQMQCCRMPDE